MGRFRSVRTEQKPHFESAIKYQFFNSPGLSSESFVIGTFKWLTKGLFDVRFGSKTNGEPGQP